MNLLDLSCFLSSVKIILENPVNLETQGNCSLHQARFVNDGNLQQRYKEQQMNRIKSTKFVNFTSFFSLLRFRAREEK